MAVRHFWFPLIIVTAAILSHLITHLVDPVDMVLLDLTIGLFCLEEWNHKQALTWECCNRYIKNIQILFLLSLSSFSRQEISFSPCGMYRRVKHPLTASRSTIRCLRMILRAWSDTLQSPSLPQNSISYPPLDKLISQRNFHRQSKNHHKYQVSKLIIATEHETN